MNNPTTTLPAGTCAACELISAGVATAFPVARPGDRLAGIGAMLTARTWPAAYAVFLASVVLAAYAIFPAALPGAAYAPQGGARVSGGTLSALAAGLATCLPAAGPSGRRVGCLLGVRAFASNTRPFIPIGRQSRWLQANSTQES